MTELKPCPFCGGTNTKMYSLKDPSLHGFIHICDGFDDYMVKVESRLFSTEEEAIEAWNRRANKPDKDISSWVVKKQSSMFTNKEVDRERRDKT